MMNRFIPIFLSFLSVLAVYGRNDWYETPQSLPAGEHSIAADVPSAEEAIVHVRLSLPAKHSQSWAIEWGESDKVRYRAQLLLPAKDVHDDIITPRAVAELWSVGQSGSELISRREMDGVDTDGRMNSIKVVYSDGRARVFAGSTNSAEIGEIDFDGDFGEVKLISSTNARCQRIQAEFSDRRELSKSRFLTLEDLNKYLARSNDPAEGAWEYMDRNVDADKAVLGGRYRIATVQSGDHYDIVYIGGAEIEPWSWEPLMLKGRMNSTIFDGNFDLVWMDAYHHAIAGDSNAQLSDDHAVLTLRIPEIKAEIRMRRLPVSALTE